MKTPNLIYPYFLFTIPLLLISFTTGDNKSEYPIPWGANSVCCADLNLDGFKDISIGVSSNGQNWGGVYWIYNDGNGYFFQNDSSYLIWTYQKNIYASDVNNDGYPDFLARNLYNSADNIAVLKYSDGVYETSLYPLGEIISGFNVGNLNSDNDIDIVVYRNGDQYWGIMYNNGSGDFTVPEYYFISGSHPTDIACGDLNGDGRDDVVVGGARLEVFYSYDAGFVQDSIGYQQGLVHLGDMDKDGDNDVVCLAGGFSTTFATIYENLGSEEFFKHETFSYTPYCSSFVLSDLDNDSLPDLVTVNNDNGLYILYNEGNFQLSYPILVSVPISGVDFLSTCCADIDNNNFSDLIVVQSTGNLKILFNDGNGNFQEDPITHTTSDLELQTSKLKCYPNPFSTNTNIYYSLDNKATVQLRIYNNSGQIVRSIEEGTKSGGNHFVEFDANGLKNGIYFYSISINGQVSDSKKMTIL